MEELAEEARSGKSKRGVRLAAALFFGVMLALTLFSNTYLNLSLPKVRVDTPTLGALSYTVAGSGTLSAHHEVPLYDRTGWTVKRIDAAEGDRVKKDQVLVVLDTDAAEQNLADERARYHKLELQMEQLELNYKTSAFGGGEAALEQAKLQIESLKDDMAIEQRKVAQLERQLADDAQIRAPVDGIVVALSAVEGLPDSSGQPVATVADLSQGFDLTAPVSAELAERIPLGKSVNIRLQGDQPRVLPATVAKLADAPPAAAGGSGGGAEAGGKLLTLSVKDASLAGGEFAAFQWTETGTARSVLVPTAAVHQDSEGSYVYVLSEDKKPLGNEFRVQAVYVTAGDADSVSTEIQSGLLPTERIVTDSSAPLSDGDRVRID